MSYVLLQLKKLEEAIDKMSPEELAELFNKHRVEEHESRHYAILERMLKEKQNETYNRRK